ncbi:hypothetical protein N658DRAFT_550016 [Parathielavia hyrcaniae]|uniref:Uncharacterized protein n=1 Tax=Parathielavia hyrcaniae TaxID=113614 RepID=A0AAN6T324_9PEZI|nr:hypothetical protein N658DRAFT_550016 [Parathielavia hyrcaniae]
MEGDIAFLRHASTFSDAEKASLINRSAGKKGHLPVGATGHPIIVLQYGGDKALVTTVSSYAWDQRRLAPWNQQGHQRKARDDFRAFSGSERPNHVRDWLRLRPGQQFPKPEASWVYAQCAYVVPLSVIGRFDKVKGSVLRMTDESLRDLFAHMEASCPTWSDCQSRFSPAASASTSAPAFAPAPVAAASAFALQPTPPPRPRFQGPPPSSTWSHQPRNPWDSNWRKPPSLLAAPTAPTIATASPAKVDSRPPASGLSW